MSSTSAPHQQSTAFIPPTLLLSNGQPSQIITLVPFQPSYYIYDGSSEWKMDSVAGTYTQDVPDKIFLNEEPSTHGAISDDTNGNKKKRRKNKNYEALSRVENARSGPWTLEEQIYAMKIMDEFEAGRLPEIPPKWTLRVLLAHKLKCHKMRISKKFGGRCKGKVPFEHRKLLIHEFFKCLCLFTDSLQKLL